MKNGLKFLGLSAIVLGGLLTSATASAIPKTYPLVCRGGAGTLGLNSQNSTGLFYFQKAAGPAGAGLSVGQCSWVDRAIGANEPTCLKQTGVVAAAWIFPNNLGQSYMSSTNAPWLRSLLQAGTFQTFQVYNPGNTDCFVVTRLGP
jgi:hypothetical protein